MPARFLFLIRRNFFAPFPSPRHMLALWYTSVLFRFFSARVEKELAGRESEPMILGEIVCAGTIWASNVREWRRGAWCTVPDALGVWEQREWQSRSYRICSQRQQWNYCRPRAWMPIGEVSVLSFSRNFSPPSFFFGCLRYLWQAGVRDCNGRGIVCFFFSAGKG